MIYKCAENHKDLILDFLENDPITNLFVIADIERYGFDSLDQDVWAYTNDLDEIKGLLLRYKDIAILKNVGLFTTILISWGIALLEYMLMVPANKIGASVNDGPFNMWQLKLIQEVISISIFVLFTLLVFKTDTLKWNHLVGFLFLIGAVFFFFKK